MRQLKNIFFTVLIYFFRNKNQNKKLIINILQILLDNILKKKKFLY